MEAQMSSVDPEYRRACFVEVQRIVLEHLPLLDLVVPHALVGYGARLQGVRATPFSHSLWNSDELSMARPGSADP
jgi:ABC-type transport system substrate-binding protein